MCNNIDIPETINQMINYVSGIKLKQESLKKELEQIRVSLKRMKTSPELHNSCSIDFKIDNPEYYFNKIQSLIRKDHVHLDD